MLVNIIAVGGAIITTVKPSETDSLDKKTGEAGSSYFHSSHNYKIFTFDENVKQLFLFPL